MNPTRFGIVGCGGIAGLHAECLKKLEHEGLARLVAGAENFPGTRAKFGEKWGVPMHETLPQLLGRNDIDVVTVCSPSGMHGQHSIEIAKSGRHVLCEKPLDLKLSVADEAIATAKAHHVVLSGIFQQRFAPGPMKVKRAVDQGFFGKLVLLHCETPWYRSQAYYDSGAWRGTWDLDGGVLSNQAPHMIDRLLWLGGEVEEVLHAACDCGKERKVETETVAVASLRFKNGALGTITGTTLAYEGMPQRVLVCGTEGSAAFQGDELTYFKTSKPFEPEDSTPTPAAPGAPGGKQAADPLALSGDGHLGNIRDFVLALREHRPPAVPAEDYRRVVWLLNEIYKKAEVGPFARH